MPIIIEGNTVTVEEMDKWHRFLTWTYKRGRYHRDIFASEGSKVNSEHRETSQLLFAGAFWREWKKDRGI